MSRENNFSSISINLTSNRSETRDIERIVVTVDAQDMDPLTVESTDNFIELSVKSGFDRIFKVSLTLKSGEEYYGEVVSDLFGPKVELNIPVYNVSEKIILKFELEGISSTTEINYSNINITVPYGTDPKTMTPNISFIGVSIEPDNRTQVDLTNPVIYRITAENGSVREYSVSLVYLPNPVVADPVRKPIFNMELVGSVSWGSYGVIDLNNDSVKDIILFQGIDKVTPYIQSGGVFTPEASVTSDGQDVYGANAIDLNSDGYGEFLTAGPNGSASSLNATYYNSGGTLQTPITTHGSHGIAFYGNKVVGGDVNGDGNNDVVWFDGTKIYYGTGNGLGGFSSINQYPGKGTFTDPKGYDINDIDGDGKNDILISNSHYDDLTDGSLEFFLNNGNGFDLVTLNKSDYSTTFTGTINPFGATICDIDGGGKNDLVFYNKSSVTSEKGIWIGIRESSNGSSLSYNFTKVANSVLESSVVYYIEGEDIEGDGDMDFVASHQNGVILFTNRGDSSFDSVELSTTGLSYRAEFHDMDGDGYLDIVADSAGDFKIWYY